MNRNKGFLKKGAKERIIKVAERRFIERGYENVSLRKLAQELGFSYTLPYKYFKNKKALLLEIMKRGRSRLAERFDKINKIEYFDPQKKIESLIKAYIDFCLDNPGQFKLWLHNSVPSQESEQMILDAKGERFQAFQSWINALAACRDKNLLKFEDIDLSFQLLWASVHGLLSLLIDYPQYPWKPRELLVDSLLLGILDGYFK